MAEEPQPAQPGPVPTAAEKEREAAALSNLSSQKMTAEDDDEAGGHSTSNTAALDAAVSNLSIGGGSGAKDGVADGATAKGAAGSSSEVATGGAASSPAPAKKVKVSDADIGFLVRELEVSKKNANEMLVNAGGDRSVAVRTFVMPVKLES